MRRNKKQNNLDGQISFEDYNRNGSMYYAMHGRRKTVTRKKNGSSGGKGG